MTSTYKEGASASVVFSAYMHDLCLLQEGARVSIGQFCLQGLAVSLVPPCFLLLVSGWLRKVSPSKCCLLGNTHLFYNKILKGVGGERYFHLATYALKMYHINE